MFDSYAELNVKQAEIDELTATLESERVVHLRMIAEERKVNAEKDAEIACLLDVVKEAADHGYALQDLRRISIMAIEALARIKKKQMLIDKSKQQDKVFLFILTIAASLFLYLLYLSLWWVLFSPFYLYLAMQLASFCATGHAVLDLNKDTIVLTTNLFTVGEQLVPCQILIYSDKLIVTTKNRTMTKDEMVAAYKENKANGVCPSMGHRVEVLVPLANITNILFEDKTNKDLESGGFGIEFEDEEGSGTVMCHNAGYGAIKKTKKQVVFIKEMCDKIKLNEVSVIDFPAIRDQIGREVIHREK